MVKLIAAVVPMFKRSELTPNNPMQECVVPCCLRFSTQDAKPSKIKVQRFYRPEDISKDEAYKASFWDVYATPEPSSSSSSSCEWVQWVDVDYVVRRCAAKAVGAKVPEGEPLHCISQNDQQWTEYAVAYELCSTCPAAAAVCCINWVNLVCWATGTIPITVHDRLVYFCIQNTAHSTCRC